MLKINQGEIVAINSPSTCIEKIELPGGDPTSLYYAMVIVNKMRKKCLGDINFDSEIFNPKIWNDKAKECLKRKIEEHNPKYILLSNTSPSHPYAIEISDFIKSIVSDVIIILGGPHEDETMIGEELNHGATLLDQYKGNISVAIDFVISGDGEYSLESLLRMLESYNGDKKEIFSKLANKGYFNSTKGVSTIGTLYQGEIIITETSGKKVNMGELPSIYDFFNNNSYFDVFTFGDGRVKKTAHIMSTRGCTFNCTYCSESTKAHGNTNVLKKSKFIVHVFNQIQSAINKGSESAFFEDSIFMQGNIDRILTLTDELIKRRKSGDIPDYFEWGCQMTIENVLRFGDKAEDVLNKMKLAGCTYIFYGIESLSEDVMAGIHKNNILKNQFYSSWIEKVDKILIISKKVGLKVGASILFGLPGETKQTIDYTINGMANFINEGKLALVSPNIVTYHPGTELTLMDGKQDSLDYITNYTMTEPYTFFEEASPGKVSIRINEDMMYYIKEQCERKLKVLNKIKTGPDYSDNKVQDFYSNNGGELLVDDDNYPQEIKDFLVNERNVTIDLLFRGGYDLLFEVGCMNARNVNISLDLGIGYFGIDIVQRYIEEAKIKISSSGIKDSFVKVLSADKVKLDNIVIGASEKPLVLFPFNSFGNIENIRSTLLSFSALGFDLLISTYGTDDFSNEVRYNYYINCGYEGLQQNEGDESIVFSSNEGLHTSVYKEQWLRKLIKESGYGNIEVISYGGIGKGYYIRK
ncbi:MAG: radical SAM protein [Candidatus Gracilibacteria bacterium]|nr:radical SAM protein [Candidatus Gracilibacteria bacterium]